MVTRYNAWEKGHSKPRIAVVNLGCRVNRVETDLIARRLVDAGCSIAIGDEASADVIVINTCAVTGEAQAKTRKAVRHAARLVGASRVVVCGCAVSLFAEELRTSAPDIVLETQKDLVPSRVLSILGADAHAAPTSSELAVAPTPTGRMRPGIKIQDGCDNRCSFCIVWKARGPSRSLPSKEIIRAIDEACARGAHEVVLTGINLGSYRAPSDDDLGKDARLEELLGTILSRTGIERVRLSSIEPPDVTDALLDVMAQSGGRIAPFLHICLQSGCDATLERMGRLYRTSHYAQIVKTARRRLHKVAIGTDVIVGFPGETDEEFAETCDFCRQMGFAKMHIFRYSRRPGTPAARFANQVDPHTSSRRSKELRRIAHDLRMANLSELDGERDDVLVIAPGRAIDSRLFEVKVNPQLEVDSMVNVRLELDDEGELKGLVDTKS